MNPAPRILIVDDEPRMCESLELLLAGEAFEVHTASSGKEALGRLESTGFDVALLDVFMPDMSGHEIMEHINRKGGGTSVILITGNATVDSAVSALRRGAYDFIKKPFNFDELLITIQNALEQKRLQREKEEINGKLALSEERYKYLVKNSPDMIYTLDPEGSFTFLSDAAERLLGVRVTSLIGKHYSAVVADEDLDRCRWYVHERRTGDRAASGVEVRFKADGNGEAKASLTKPPVVGELKSTGMYEQSNGPESRRYVGTHGVVRDISHRKHLEARLEQASRAEALGTLASGIAHNFNNILQAIQANASLCLLDLDPGSKSYDRCRNIVRYVDNGAHLTRQLLGFAQGEKTDPVPTDLNELVHQSAELFGETRKEISVHEDLQEGIWTVEVDRQQIDQVLMNVFVNAWHAMPGGGSLYLSTRNVQLENDIVSPFGLTPGPFVRIRVRDTGEGMEEEVRQRVFEPFFTTREVGQGTGLGMASAYGIVQKHGGLIYLESEWGKGTTCHICLPARPNDTVKVEEGTAPEEMPRGRETLLLVDDEEMILEASRELLTELGYTVLIAKSGPKALEIYRREWRSIDLVILDLVMPGMDGGKVYEELKRIHPDVKCILSTGHNLDRRATALLEKGCEGYLQKPFDLPSLSMELRSILDSSSPS